MRWAGWPVFGPGLDHLIIGLAEQLKLLDAAMLQRQTHAALRQVVLAQAQRQPTILIFEDLQWIDPASREFLEYLIETVENVPLLILLVSRGAERRTVLHSLVNLTEQLSDHWLDLQLKPLSQTEAGRVVDHLIPTVSSVEARHLKQKIVDRAEGNSLFIEEIVRMLVDRDGLRRDFTTGTWEFVAGQSNLLQTTPGTVKGLMMARVDSLPDGMRRTLQKAAVLGTTFAAEVMQQINSLPPAVTVAQLDEMVTRQFLLPHNFRSAAGYTFRHKLLQETLYNSLIKRDRRKIHNQVAHVIEDSNLWLTDERAEALAYHYSESDFPLKAVPYLLTAGENALRHCAYETAIKHFRQTTELLSGQFEGQSDYFSSRLGLATGLKLIGNLDEAGQILSQILENLRPPGLASLQPILIESLRQMADIQQRKGLYEAALDHLQAGLQLLVNPNDPAATLAWRALLERIAWIHFRQGQLDKALSVAQRALDSSASGSVDDPIILAGLYNTLGGIAWQQNQLDNAINDVTQSLHLYERLGYYYGIAVAYGNLGILYYQQGNWSNASHYYKNALNMHQMIGNRDGQAVSLDNRGILYLAMGRHKDAQIDLEAALTIRQQLGDQWGVAQTRANLAQLALAQEDIASTAHQAQLALTISEKIDSLEIKAEALWITALVHAEQGQLEKGLEVAQQALGLAQKAGLVQHQTHSLRVLGRLSAAADEPEAEDLLQQALALSRQRNDPYLQGLVLKDLAQFYQTRHPAQARAHFEEAAACFEQIGAMWQLQKVRTVLTG